MVCTVASLLRFCSHILRPQVARGARHLGWSAALEGPTVAALFCDFIAMDESADFWSFAKGLLGPALL